MSEALVVLCTCPDEAAASRLAEGLVQQRLAACVNVLSGIRSIYRWRGTLNDDTEVLLVIKTTGAQYPRLEQWLASHHPFEVPEIVALPVSGIFAPYLAWLEDSVGT